MKKEFIYFTIALMLFCVGFLIGKTQNDSGRYFLKEYTNGANVFDTKTGVSYFYDGDKKIFYKVDVKNAKGREEINTK